MKKREERMKMSRGVEEEVCVEEQPAALGSLLEAA